MLLHEVGELEEEGREGDQVLGAGDAHSRVVFPASGYTTRFRVLAEAVPQITGTKRRPPSGGASRSDPAKSRKNASSGFLT